MALFTRRIPVVDQVAGKVWFEQGSPSDVGQPAKAAILVHWSATPQVNRSFRTLVNEVAEHGYLPVVVSACEAEDKLDWSGELPSSALVVRKPNVGYDFGSWSVGMHLLPSVTAADSVLLLNDSLVGPFTSLTPVLEDFEATPGDAWGLTDTYQYFHHLQSFFLGFRGGMLQDAPLRRFWAGVAEERTKWDIIRNNELALTKLLLREGYVIRSAFRSVDFVQPGQNPVITGWQRMLKAGFPFVKRELVRDPDVAADAQQLPRVLESVYGVKLDEWV